MSVSKRIVFAAFTLMGFFIVIEGGLRLFLPQPPRGFSKNLFEDNSDHSGPLRVDAEGTQLAREFLVHIAGDERGYRRGLSHPEGNIWVVGDSFVFGWGVEAEDAACGILVRRGYPILNMGMPQSGLDRHAERIEEATEAGYVPSRIVIVLYDNDMSEPLMRENRDPSERGRRGRSRSIRSLLLNLHIARAMTRVLYQFADVLPERRRYIESLTYVVRRDLAIHRKDASTDAWRGKLESLLDTANRFGVPVDVVRIAPVYAQDNDRTREMIELINARTDEFDFGRLDETLETIAAEHGATYRRFAPPQSAYYESDMHLNVDGNRRFADFLEEILQEAPKATGQADEPTANQSISRR